jgi:hypothetical protein
MQEHLVKQDQMVVKESKEGRIRHVEVLKFILNKQIIGE